MAKMTGTVTGTALTGTVNVSEITAKLDLMAAQLEEIEVKIDSLVLGSGNGGSGGNGGNGDGGTLPPDTNTYPLTMPNVSAGADVVVGEGPNRIDLLLSAWGGQPGCFSLFVATHETPKKLIAAQFMVTAQTGMAGGQRFQINGSWGSVSSSIYFASGNLEAGLFDLWMNGASYDFEPAGLAQSTVFDSRGSVTPAGALTLWDNTGVPFELLAPASAIVAPEPPEPPLPPLEQDLIDGKTLQQLVDETPSGGVLTLPAGIFHAEAKTRVPMTIRCATKGETTLTGEGGFIDNGKGLLNAIADLIVENLILTKAAVADHNGAGVRAEPNVKLTMRGVEVSFCENGILSAADGDAATVSIDNCDFHDNGYGTGAAATHEIYIGHGCASLTVTNSTFKCSAKSTHAIKSRAAANTIKTSHLIGSPDTSGDVSGSVLDIPDGGAWLVEDTIIEMAPGQANHMLVGYAMESGGHGALGGTMQRVQMIATSSDGGKITTNKPGVDLNLSACTHAGPLAPVLEGWASVTGEFAPV